MALGFALASCDSRDRAALSAGRNTSATVTAANAECLPPTWHGGTLESVPLGTWTPDSIVAPDSVLAAFPVGTEQIRIVGQGHGPVGFDHLRVMLAGRSLAFTEPGDPHVFDIVGLEGSPTLLRAKAFRCGSGGCNGALTYVAVDPAQPGAAVGWAVPPITDAIEFNLEGDMEEVVRCAGSLHANADGRDLTISVGEGSLSLTSHHAPPPPPTVVDQMMAAVRERSAHLAPLTDLPPGTEDLSLEGNVWYKAVQMLDERLNTVFNDPDLTARVGVYASRVDFGSERGVDTTRIRVLLAAEMQENAVVAVDCPEQKVLPRPPQTEVGAPGLLRVRCVRGRVLRANGAVVFTAETFEFGYDEEYRFDRQRVLTRDLIP